MIIIIILIINSNLVIFHVILGLKNVFIWKNSDIYKWDPQFSGSVYLKNII